MKMLEELINNSIEMFKMSTGNDPKVIVLHPDDLFSLPIKKSILNNLVYVYKKENYRIRVNKRIEPGNFYVQ